jgi:hypothetical protein
MQPSGWPRRAEFLAQTREKRNQRAIAGTDPVFGSFVPTVYDRGTVLEPLQSNVFELNPRKRTFLVPKAKTQFSNNDR